MSSRLSRRPALFPPKGEEKEERQAVEPVRHRSQRRVAHAQCLTTSQLRPRSRAPGPVNPAVAIVAVIVGANLAGVLGALLAIPTAASLGVVIDELVPSGPADAAGPEPEPAE